MRRLRAMMGQASATMAKADRTMDQGQVLMVLAKELMAIGREMMEDLRDEGIEIGLEIVGWDVPIEIEIRIGDDDRVMGKVKGFDQVEWGALWQKALDKLGEVEWAALLTKLVAFLLPLIMGAMSKDKD